MKDEASLVEALQVEETREAAFEEVVRRYYGLVRRWIRSWVSDPALTEELTQEVFLSAWKSIHTFRGQSRLSSWLYVIARRAAFRTLKQRQRERWVPWPQEDGQPVEMIAEEDTPYERLWQELEAARETFSPIQQRVFAAFWEQGLSYREIAAKLGVSPNTIKAHVFHIRQRLWKALQSWLGD